MSRKTILPKQLHRRTFCVNMIFIFLLFGLIYRLYDIQIVKGEKYKEQLERQSTIKVSLNSSRGSIYDRNNNLLTDTQTKKLIMIEKKSALENRELSSLIVELSEKYLNTENFVYNVSSEYINIEVDSLDFNLEKKLVENGVIIEDKTYRYDDNGLLAHTIGYINEDENKGVSGIEKYQKDILDNSSERYISVFKAGQAGGNVDNQYVGSLDSTAEVIEDEGSHIKITIDKKLQEEVEKIVDKEENPSAVIISDAQTGEILSMSSRPNFDQYNIQNYLTSENKELINRVTQVSYQPASTFKMVVLFSAFENKIIDENYTYTCVGHESVKNSGEEISCVNNAVHGYQTLKEAFANSCNSAFMDISNKMSDDLIIETAKRLKLGDTIDIGIEEVKGNVEENTDSRNLPIGQGSIEVTPIQLNQMTQIIANNGTYKPLYLYDSIIDNNKDTKVTFKSEKQSEIISPYIVTNIKDIMSEVSISGTAKDLQELKYESGVKTGTSQTKVNGVSTNNWLISGFYPKDNSKYVITVVVEGSGDISQDEGKSAVPIFKDICLYLDKSL